MNMTEHHKVTFSRCRVRLDDNAYRNCSFDNVIFEYDGRPFVFEENQVGIYVLSLQGEFAQSLSSLRSFSQSIGSGAVEGVITQVAAMLRPATSLADVTLN